MSDLFSGLTTSLKSTATAITRNEYVRKIAETMNDTIMNYSEPELAVREATNEDPWGPTGPQMKKIVEYTRSRHMEDFYNVYTPLFARMLENNKDAWRRVYKSLVLFDYLLKNGSERFVNESREKIYELRKLERYHYTDEKGKDQGINIRHRVKLILDLLNDEDKLREERGKANSDDKSKYRGFDQYEMKMSSSSSAGFGSSSSSSSNWKKSGNSDFNSDNSKYGKKDNREVSNFSFSSNNRSPSPELGFVNDDSKKKEEEDDGFGDFVSSRSAQTAPTTTNTANAKRSNSLFDSIPSIPPPSSGSAAAVPLPRKPSLDNSSNFDLLGGLDAPALAAPQTNMNHSIDLFSQITTSPLAATPTKPVASTQPSSGFDLFDFGSSPIATTQHVPTQPAAGFDNFDFGSSFGNNSQPLSAAPLQATSTSAPSVKQATVQPGNQAGLKVGNAFAGLDQFMNLSLSPSGGNTQKAKTLNQMMGGN